MFTYQQLRDENTEFAGTGGVSQNNHQARFLPAFRDERGRIEVPRLDNGQVAPMHLLSGLPDDWVTERDGDGRVTAIRDGIIAGFVRDDVFYTRAQAAALA